MRTNHPRTWLLGLFLLSPCSTLTGCGIPSKAYRVTTGTIKTTYRATEGATRLTAETGRMVYDIGGYTFKVIRAPMSFTLTRGEIETIDGLSPKEAIRQGRVKNSPYTVMGKSYYPMTVEEAARYREVGMASWYGRETLRKQGGHMTANGEVFDPDRPTAAHKHLPLPIFARVTNLENRRSIIVRVNDRGPFVGGRIIDLSAGAARRLGFYEKGTARVLVQTLDIK